MRSLGPAVLLVLLTAGCPRPRPVAPSPATPAAKPAADVAAAAGSSKPSGDAAPSDDQRLGDGAPKVVQLDVVHLDVVGRDANGDPVIEAKTPAPLLEQGNAEFAKGRYPEAERFYRQLVTEFGDSAIAPAALYNIGLAREKAGTVDPAIEAYLELTKTYPASTEAAEGGLRAAALLAEAERWKDATTVLRTLEARNDLDKQTRVEVKARLGYVLLEQNQLDEAERTLGDAVAIWRVASRIEDTYYIAMAHFYLGEVAARRFDAQPVRSADDALSADMRTKRELLLRAYGHWKDALPYNEAYWGTAAGYEMSQIFYEYWQAAVRAPFPDGMTADARPMYVREVHDRVRENLTKALDGHRANVDLAAAYGVETAWSRASKARAAEILSLLDREARGEAAAPPP